MARESSRTDPTRQATSALLSNGVRMPLVGYGCAGRIGRKPLGEALELGYALFDTSQASEWYLEEELGVALAMSSVNRSAVFLTSKLHPRDLGEQSTLRAFPASLRNLQTSTIDAFLLHYPRCFGGGPHTAVIIVYSSDHWESTSCVMYYAICIMYYVLRTATGSQHRLLCIMYYVLCVLCITHWESTSSTCTCS